MSFTKKNVYSTDKHSECINNIQKPKYMTSVPQLSKRMLYTVKRYYMLNVLVTTICFAHSYRQRPCNVGNTGSRPFTAVNPLNAELHPICCLLALLGPHHFLHISRIRLKSLTLRLLMSCIYGAPILDVSRSHTTTHHSR